MVAFSKGLEFISEIASDVPDTLIGDPRRIRQILVNLVSNAIKFTSEGIVLVRMHRPDATHWAFFVSDTGRGIPAETQNYIFDPFRQVDSFRAVRGLHLDVYQALRRRRWDCPRDRGRPAPARRPDTAQ